jgi:hypothetical protein
VDIFLTDSPLTDPEHGLMAALGTPGRLFLG